MRETAYILLPFLDDTKAAEGQWAPPDCRCESGWRAFVTPNKMYEEELELLEVGTAR